MTIKAIMVTKISDLDFFPLLQLSLNILIHESQLKLVQWMPLLTINFSLLYLCKLDLSNSFYHKTRRNKNYFVSQNEPNSSILLHIGLVYYLRISNLQKFFTHFYVYDWAEIVFFKQG